MTVLEIDDILALLPHRPPFLLVDRAWIVERGRRGAAVKLLARTEPPFDAAGEAALPAALVVEAMNQAAAVVLLEAYRAQGLAPGRAIGFLASLADVEFAGEARPGEVLTTTVTIEKRWADLAMARSEATAGGRPVCRGRAVMKLQGKAQAQAQA